MTPRAVTAILLLAATTAHADIIPACRVPISATPTGLADLPPALREALHQKLGTIAQPNQPFNATDMIEPNLPSRRLIFIWSTPDRWIIATEHGGLAYNDPILAYTRTPTPTLLAERYAFPNTVCRTALELLNLKK